MTFKHADLVEETSTTTSTGTYTLDGASSGRQTFVAGCGANAYCTYSVKDSASGNWELNIGQVLSGPARVTRETLLASSTGAAINWGVGTRTLREVQSAEFAAPRMTSKSVAGAANVTLTQDEMRCDVLELTGALTGNIDVIVDATVWDWPAVYNNTSGAFTLTFKVTGQTGLAITQGKRRAVHCDGTDIRDSGGDPLASEFASGTRMIFQQTTAPTGWTKETNATYNDAAFRITTGTVGTGGADVFTTVFGTGKSTSGFTLGVAESPAHAHTATSVLLSDIGTAQFTSGSPNFATSGNRVTDNTGGGGSHAHALTSLNLKYADIIIAQKD